MENPIVIGIDAGGTMTDTILVDQHGHFKIGKSATTPRDEAEGFIASAADAAEAWGISLDELFSGVNVVLYSGTGMLNTLLSRTGRKLGLITTKGLEDMILMGRGLQAWADYSYADRRHAVTHHHPDALVPRRRTHGVTERTDQFGDVVIPLYEHEAVKAAQALIRDKVDAICIMTIFSHVNPVHEKRIAEICREEIAKAGGDIMVYTSHEVRPVIREQSRLNSVLIEAYATSRGRQQLKGIEDASKKYGFKYGVQTLLSFGGLTSINHPRLHETMISGPIGGILGAAYVGKLIGNDSLICSDMGGTSFDMGVITRGQTRIENEPLMDRFKLKPYLDDKSIEVVATNLTGAKYTFAVPKYVADAGVKDFADLQKFPDRFEKKIYGIEPGNNGNRMILDMIGKGDFGLKDWELVESSEQGMLAEVERAVKGEKWIVFLGWAPHPMNTRFKIDYLSGGDAYFGPNYGGAEVLTNIRSGYGTECPNVAKLVTNLHFTLDMESGMMGAILDEGKDPKAAAGAWLKQHPDVLTSWLAGVTTYDGGDAAAAVKAQLGL